MAGSLHLLVCQYYLREAQAVVQGPEFENVTVSAYPDVCVHPQADRMAIVERLFHTAAADDRTVMLVGACFLLRNGAQALKEDKFRRIHHTDLCFHLLANKTWVDAQMRAGAYLATPGWLESWVQHMDQWQFDQPTARAFFAESASKLVLLDTGVDPASEGRLKACAEFLGLPAETVPVGLDRFRIELLRLVQDWRLEEARRDAATAVGQANRKLADYMLAMDLLVKLTRIMSEDEAIHVILELFTMLFGATNVSYVPITSEGAGAVRSTRPGTPDADRMREWIERLGPAEDQACTETGFCVRIKYQGVTVGILAADAMAFPQHEQDYLNLAIEIVDLCGLAIANARTVTQRERAEAELRQKSDELARSNADLEQFASVASHDLQAPLRRITAFGELLEEDAGPTLNAAAREHLARMRKSASRMQRLIEGLLAYARVTTRGKPFGTVRLGAVVQQALDDLAPRIEESHGHVEIGDLPTVRADELQMYQLFQNLIGNALKFVAPGRSPTVRVTARPAASGLVEIAVADNGIGFDEAYLGKLFQPFQRLHSEEEYPGSGIGLAVCQKIAQRHGGTITAHSRPGEGATFVVTLPEGGSEGGVGARA